MCETEKQQILTFNKLEQGHDFFFLSSKMSINQLAKQVVFCQLIE